MGLSKYFVILLIAVFSAWAAWFIVLWSINPYSAGWLGFLFFYATLTVALLGSFSLLGFLFRWLTKRHEVAQRQVTIASRQSVLLTILVIIALILQSQRLLMWWNTIMLVAVTAFVELFFISYKKFDK